MWSVLFHHWWTLSVRVRKTWLFENRWPLLVKAIFCAYRFVERTLLVHKPNILSIHWYSTSSIGRCSVTVSFAFKTLATRTSWQQLHCATIVKSVVPASWSNCKFVNRHDRMLRSALLITIASIESSQSAPHSRIHYLVRVDSDWRASLGVASTTLDWMFVPFSWFINRVRSKVLFTFTNDTVTLLTLLSVLYGHGWLASAARNLTDNLWFLCVIKRLGLLLLETHNERSTLPCSLYCSRFRSTNRDLADLRLAADNLLSVPWTLFNPVGSLL
jgi:hypothetical protein